MLRPASWKLFLRRSYNESNEMYLWKIYGRLSRIVG